MLLLGVSRCWYVFFFKQKTAYEMRISDWSSDVCSSDLSRSFISAIPTSVFFDALATRFDAVKGAALKGRFQFVLPDSHEAVAVVVEGGVEFPRYGVTDAATTAEITHDRRGVDDGIPGPAHFPALQLGRGSGRETVYTYC